VPPKLFPVMTQVIIVGDLNVAATQKDCHYLIKHEKCYNAEELALLSALTSRCRPDKLQTSKRLHPPPGTRSLVITVID
jgi:exonuclease III